MCLLGVMTVDLLFGLHLSVKTALISNTIKCHIDFPTTFFYRYDKNVVNRLILLIL